MLKVSNISDTQKEAPPSFLGFLEKAGKWGHITILVGAACALVPAGDVALRKGNTDRAGLDGVVDLRRE